MHFKRPRDPLAVLRLQPRRRFRVAAGKFHMKRFRTSFRQRRPPELPDFRRNFRNFRHAAEQRPEIHAGAADKNHMPCLAVPAAPARLRHPPAIFRSNRALKAAHGRTNDAARLPYPPPTAAPSERAAHHRPASNPHSPPRRLFPWRCAAPAPTCRSRWVRLSGLCFCASEPGMPCLLQR